MDAFAARTAQLLASLAALGPGLRDRLVRPLRQADLSCWPAPLDLDDEPLVKAGLRAIAHEVLDQLCLQLEIPLQRCDSNALRQLVLALVAVSLPDGLRVRFRSGAFETGLDVPGPESLVIEPRPGELSLTWRRETIAGPELTRTLRVVIASDLALPETASFDPATAPAAPLIRVDSAQVYADPYALATALKAQLRDGTAAGPAFRPADNLL